MKTLGRQQRHRRVRAKVSGTAARPRLVVFRGAKSLSAQLVDDQSRRVLLTISSGKEKSSIEAAKVLGQAVAKAAKTKKITTAVFDRAGYQYHGKVRALAEAARQEGLEF